MSASRSLPLLLALLPTAASCGSSEQDPPADDGAAAPAVADEAPVEDDDDSAGEGGAPGGAMARLGAGVTVNGAGAAPGYVMFAPLRSRTAYIIDLEGNVLHTWENDLSPLSIYLQDDGSLLRAGRVVDNPVFNRGGRSGKIQRLGKDSEILWEFTLCDDKESLHHDYEPLPNGNILAIAWEWVSYEDAVALGRHPDYTRESGWWPGKVIEIEPQDEGGGKIVWEWHSKDHLIQDEFPDRPNYGDPAQHPERIDVNCDLEVDGRTAEQEAAHQAELKELADLGYLGTQEEEDEPAPAAGAPKRGRKHRTDDWLHLNGIDYHPEADLIVLSTPEMNEVWIIDHSTTTEEARGSTGGNYGKGGDLLYRWGNPRNYGAGTYADQQLFFQHMPEWVPPGMPGAGNLTIFNNGMGRPDAKYSSIDELALPFDMKKGFTLEKGKAFAPAKPTWQYKDPRPGGFYSFFISGAHRLPNGNTFICSGKWGRLFEVTPAGEIVWEFWNPYGGELERVFNNGGKDLTLAQSCFRATKLSPDHPGLEALGITKP